MQAATSALPMTAPQSLHTTNLKFRMISLPNLAPISCVVDSAKIHLNNFFSTRKSGFYLFEQEGSSEMYVCKQTSDGNVTGVNRLALTIDYDGVAALFRIKGEEKGELFQAFAKRLGLISTENLEGMRALAISRLNLRYTYKDAAYDLMMTPSDSYSAKIIEVEVQKPLRARHTFMICENTDNKSKAIDRAIFPILICVDSTLKNKELDELFFGKAASDQCYIRFSEPDTNQMVIVTSKMKIPLPFLISVSRQGTSFISWIGTGNYLLSLQQIIFNNRQNGYQSTSPSLFASKP